MKLDKSQRSSSSYLDFSLDIGEYSDERVVEDVDG